MVKRQTISISVYFSLNRKISGVSQAITQLAELVDDTTMQAGSEAYSAALVVYQYAKNSRMRTD
jgi:hypothetical protein